MTLEEFLAARLSEAAAGAWAIHDVAKCDALLYEEDMAAAAKRDADCDCGYPARVLREVEAGRKILVIARVATEEAKEFLRVNPGATAENPDAASAAAIVTTISLVLMAMGEVYSDHPDYDESWRP